MQASPSCRCLHIRKSRERGRSKNNSTSRHCTRLKNIENRHIIAVGGKLLVPNQPPALERYILATAGKAEPEVCFIPTASGDNAAYIDRFYEVYRGLGTRTKHLPLFAQTPRDLRSYLLSCDIIHVGGGNTRSMLALWRYWGIDAILREAWQKGIVLTGSSAGMICWFAAGVTDSLEGPLSPTDGLGFIPVSACPHFDGESARRPAYEAMITTGELPAGYAADDGAGVHFQGTELRATISMSANATAYYFSRSATGELREKRLDALQIT